MRKYLKLQDFIPLAFAIIASAFLLAENAKADLVLDTREDDPGYMEMVPESEVQIVKTLDFEGIGVWETSRDGFSWNAILSGMATECRIPQHNPCEWPETQECIDAGGTKPVNRSFGTPTLPFAPTATETGAHVLSYADGHASQIDGSRPVVVNFSRLGCEELGGSDWGDGPWAVTFDQPYQSVCFDVRFRDWELLRRQHFHFYRNNGSALEQVGHQDLVGEPGQPADRRICWVSSVPFEAVSTWQDGPGIWWLAVHVGEPALTECERATQRMEEACAVGP